MRFLILFAFTMFLIVSSEADVLDLYEKAEESYSEARFVEAISLYQEIIKNNPKDFEAYLNLAYLYKDLAEYEQAIEVIREALKYFNDNRLKMLLGRIYYLEGKPMQAILQLRKLLPLYPEDSGLLFYLGLSYEEIGKLAEAEHYYLEAVRLKPDNVLIYLRLGDIYFQEQRFKEATRNYQKVISLDPSITGVRPRLAKCFAESGEFTEAYRQYAKAVAIYPENKILQKNLERIKAKLGKDFFKKQKGLTLQRRQIKSIQVKPSIFAERTFWIRVGIAEIKGSIEFKCGSDFNIVDKHDGKSLFKGKGELIYSLVFNNKASIQLKDYQGNVLLADLAKPLLIKNESENSVISIFNIPFGIGDFWADWRDQQYRGTIEVIPDNNVFRLINLVNLEEYLYGVLPSEMPADWPEQALCAQAIAARTWAIRNKGRHNNQGYNFCSTVHCQVYKGAGSEAGFTNKAVDKTAGLILVSDNQPIGIFYSNNCGGCTQDGIVDAHTLDFHFQLSPLELERWLMGQPDTFCNLRGERSANFRWARLYKKGQLQTMLSRSGIDIGEPLKIIPQRRARSSHLISIRVEGTEDSRLIEGENNIRKILGNLLSGAFKVETKFDHENRPAAFILYGGGFGHGRGLCQTGMKGMALEGYGYQDILKHYYPNAEIKKIY